jgi:hypothetical protein
VITMVRSVCLFALSFVACVDSLPHPPYVANATSMLAPIASGPPPGRVEVVPPRPADADAWVDGEWILRHARWYWLLGRWVKVPAGARYSPWVVVRATDGTLFYAPSSWRDAHGELEAAPPPLAAATASGEAVISPDGDTEDTGRSIRAPPAEPSRPR